jgi:tetratricopeptide (TPR) repeat protein
MREFLGKKYANLPQVEQKRITKITKKINKQYNQYLYAHGSGITDRVAEAFRTSAAKAAKLALKKGDYEDAILWYEEAISVDATNAALWDRYAWSLYLMSRDLDRAKECANEAIRLDSNKADFYFTAGAIAARRGDISEADKFLIKAEELGKPKYLCLNHRAVSRIEASTRSETEEWEEILSNADKFVKKSMDMEIDDRYKLKNYLYCKKLLKRSNDIRLLRKLGAPI